jgi:hypothetical protein
MMALKSGHPLFTDLAPIKSPGKTLISTMGNKVADMVDIDQIPSVYSFDEIMNLSEPSSRGPWGNWRFKKSTNELVFKRDYYSVDLDDCKTSAAVLDWIFQLHGKAWITDADVRSANPQSAE